MKNIFLLVSLVAISLQAQQIDSNKLKRALKDATTDSARYKISSDLDTYYSEVNRDSSIYYADNCLKIAKRNNKKINEGWALNAKGYSLMRLGKFSESYRCFLLAFEIAKEEANDTKSWNLDKTKSPRAQRLDLLQNVHHTFGHLMGATGKFDQQIFHYNESKKIAIAINDRSMLGFVDMNLGKVYFKQKKFDTALQMEKEALTIFSEISKKKYLGYIYTIIGNIYLEKGNPTLAVFNFHKAVQSAKEENNYTNLQDGYHALFDFYYSRKIKDSSVFYANKELATLQFMKSNRLGDAYTSLYKSYELQQNIDSTYKYQKLALAAQDSSYEALKNNLSEFQNLTFNEKVRTENIEKDRLRTQYRIKAYLLLTGLSLFLVITFILYRNNRQKQIANRMLESTLADLRSAQSQLIQSEKMASMGELTAGIAHEIQNPLNFVNNFSEVSSELLDEMNEELNKGEIEEAKAIAADIKQNLEKINYHGKRADGIVKGMLQHSRSGSLTKEPTDINKLADEYLRLAYHGLRAKDKSFNAELVTNFEPSLPKATVLPQDIGRVLLNLFTNAFYATHQMQKQLGSSYKPTVSVTTSKKENYMEITVKDNGIGIPDSIKDKILQPFFTTKPAGEGTGLGLSLSYDIIVKGHDGNIIIDSIEKEYTIFTIQIPIG